MSERKIARERVARGAQWLDEEVGPEWVERVNLDTLNLTSTTRCVLGQVFVETIAWESGFFAAAILCGASMRKFSQRVGAAYDEPMKDLGFICTTDYPIFGAPIKVTARDLKQEWKSLIHQRKLDLIRQNLIGIKAAL